jgi:hypothetical protein
MDAFNSYSGLEFNPNAFSSSSSFNSGGGYSFPDYSGAFSPKTGSDTWQKGFALKGDDPFGLNKSSSQDKKESPFTDFARFAGEKLSSYAQNRYGQGGRSDGLAVGGGGGVSQSGDLTIVYPQPSQVIPAQGGGLGGTIGSIAGAALGTLIAPGIGTSIGGQLGGAAGSFF